MTRTAYIEYIHRQTYAIAISKYSNPQEAIAYQLGLTQAILADCMYNDNLNTLTVKQHINRLAKEYKLQ